MAFLNAERFRNAIGDLVFPPVCACCGDVTISRTEIICEFCIRSRFEPDHEDESILLPDFVQFRYALWQFDKMGYLQDLLHKLKYDHLAGVGRRLGKEIGRALVRNQILENLHQSAEKTLLIPVPLHKKRYRKRGYNQSRVIAEGINRAAGIDLIPEGAIIRRKRTKTQTGLNSRQRTKNLSGAFQLAGDISADECFAVIVDDVYTTGATTFELAGMLNREIGIQSAIVTIART
ncbi:ComF family protein [Rhodohalobacter sp. SW132]|uniref:ComF family protein n=1 Tax=Rhodohalobacter sp. SW132 TaxID=2293433 RepID=UPI000E242C2D|nr:ComF family protein [Rhodohalobacter sp. SW132]REL37561.1 ComF family protein [Rhodohalobacter sp. SW132]